MCKEKNKNANGKENKEIKKLHEGASGESKVEPAKPNPFVKPPKQSPQDSDSK
jgi:hypothetical protein